VEAGATLSWWRYVGNEGRVIGIDHFGASGKGAAVLARFGSRWSTSTGRLANCCRV